MKRRAREGNCDCGLNAGLCKFRNRLGRSNVLWITKRRAIVEQGSPSRWRETVAALVAAAALAAAFVAAATMFAPTRAAEPARGFEPPLCCGVPAPDEVTADQVFGRWVIMRAGVGAPVQRGERIEFRRDGTLAIDGRVCRFAILRAELSVACDEDGGVRSLARKRPAEVTGDVRFVDDTKLIWRIDDKATVHIAPAD
jgi:hypothetical protein